MRHTENLLLVINEDMTISFDMVEIYLTMWHHMTKSGNSQVEVELKFKFSHIKSESIQAHLQLITPKHINVDRSLY